MDMAWKQHSLGKGRRGLGLNLYGYWQVLSCFTLIFTLHQSDECWRWSWWTQWMGTGLSTDPKVFSSATVHTETDSSAAILTGKTICKARFTFLQWGLIYDILNSKCQQCVHLWIRLEAFLVEKKKTAPLKMFNLGPTLWCKALDHHLQYQCAIQMPIPVLVALPLIRLPAHTPTRLLVVAWSTSGSCCHLGVNQRAEVLLVSTSLSATLLNN